jgi:Uma2 family endonuclease
MTVIAKKPATYADLEKVPPHLVAEIIHGVLETHPRPHKRHGGVSSYLGYELIGPYGRGRGGPGGWVFYDEPQLHLGEDVLIPDLAGWRKERLAGTADEPYFHVPPDWVCEILSPSTERLDRTRKRSIYARAGIPYLWLFDPEKRLIEAFALRGDVWSLVATASGAEAVRLPPFEAAVFPMDDLFPLDPPFSEDDEG